MMVRTNRWYHESTLVLFAGRGIFYFFGGFEMYKKVSTNMNFVQREKEVLQFWTDTKRA